MKNEKINNLQPVNRQRRKLLQGAAFIGAAGVAPAAAGLDFTGNGISIDSAPSTSLSLSGELICNIANPVKTLVLRNNSSRTMVIDHLEQSAFMFDGSIVDCNTACQAKPITIPAFQEVRVQFDRRQQAALTHVDEFQRVQSRVARRTDGTRVIPFSATLHGGVATVV